MKKCIVFLIDGIAVISVLCATFAMVSGNRPIGAALFAVVLLLLWKRRELRETLCDFAIHDFGPESGSDFQGTTVDVDVSSHSLDSGGADGGSD